MNRWLARSALRCAVALSVIPLTAVIGGAARMPAGSLSHCAHNFGANTPVLLVHGFHEPPTGPEGTWTTGTPSMAAAIAKIPGVKVVTPFDYYSTASKATDWVTDPTIGAALASDIICLAQASTANGGPGKVIIVAHSMGGLAVRCAVDPACVNRVNTGAPRPAATDKQIELVITLGTPNTGSVLANLSGALANQRTTLERMVVGAVCKRITGCEQYAALGGTAAAAAMREGSAELDPNYPKPDPNLLPPLPSSIPLHAIAGKITFATSLFGNGSFEIPVGDVGDVVVPVNSALAESSPTTTRTGSGSGNTTINCGTIPIDQLNLWGGTSGVAASVKRDVTCWHLTGTTNRPWQAAVVAAIQAATTTPSLYVHNGIVLGSLFKSPNFPATIGLDNHDFLSELQWAQINANGARARGTLNVNSCTPNCASGTTMTYPVELIASNPQHCTVAVYKQFSSASKQEQAYVFNKIQVKALSGNPPSNLVGSTPTLPPACGSSPPTPVPVPTPIGPSTSPSASPTSSSSPTSSTVTITIRANAGWVDTGLSLNMTDSVEIRATGSWTPDGTDYTGPDGFGQSLLSADNYINLTDLGACATCATSMYPEWAALMSYTGSNPPQPGSYTSTAVAPQANLVDYVGSSLTTTKFWPYKGELWLGINDDAYSGMTSDNSGQVTATITVTPP